MFAYICIWMYTRQAEWRPSVYVVASCTHVNCVRAYVRVHLRGGRSVGRRRRAFPFRIAKVQRAIPQCAYFYIHSRRTCEVRIIRPTGQKKTLAECRNDSTVSFSDASSFFLCSCSLPRKLICQCKPCPRKLELPLSKSPLSTFVWFSLQRVNN